MYQHYYYPTIQQPENDERLLLFPLLFAAGLAGGFGWGRPRPYYGYPYGGYGYGYPYGGYGYGYGYGYPYGGYGYYY